jgi:nucleoside-diphosphate-sugar epimerase
MRVFVAGATGVVGRRAVLRLLSAGHEVTAVARTAEKAASLRRTGARPARVDIFDEAALRDAMTGHDAVVNLATKIPPLRDMAKTRAWEENERIRREASGALVDAAIAAGVRVFVQESLAFLYGEHGDEWVDASHTAWTPSVFSDAMGVAEANVARFTEAGGRGIVLRFGKFYAPDSDQFAAIVRAARRGFAADLGTSDSYSPLIDVDDAATAVVAALDAPAGTYDIVDDEPLTRRDQQRVLAGAVGRRRLWHLPASVAPKRASYLAASQRVSNARFRDATGWRPGSPSVREGFPKLVRDLHEPPALHPGVRLILWLLGLTALSLAIQGIFTPHSFYNDFPTGRGWIAADGPYNQHLVRDFGALNLALFVTTAGALWMSTRTAARVAAVAWLAWSVPHLVYHLAHLGIYDTGDAIGNVVSLSLPILGALVVYAAAGASYTADRGPQPVSGRPVAAVRDDDLRGDVGARGGDRVDQSRAGVPGH